MKDSAKYVKLVEWSDGDQCYVGSAPGLFDGGCHGTGEKAVFEELCAIVEEVVALYRKDGRCRHRQPDTTTSTSSSASRSSALPAAIPTSPPPDRGFRGNGDHPR